MRKTYSWLLGLGMAMFILSPASAQAWTVYQGSDYTRTVNNTYGFKVCDQESDGRGVRGTAWDGRGAEANESDGGDAGCDQRRNPPDIGRIDHLRTCEIINNWPDACRGYRS